MDGRKQSGLNKIFQNKRPSEETLKDKMSNTFITTVQIFLWKHWKCFQCSWIKNVFMIVVPIAIAWFQIHVSSSTTKGVQSNFQTITEVSEFNAKTISCVKFPTGNAFMCRTNRHFYKFIQSVSHLCSRNVLTEAQFSCKI